MATPIDLSSDLSSGPPPAVFSSRKPDLPPPPPIAEVAEDDADSTPISSILGVRGGKGVDSATAVAAAGASTLAHYVQAPVAVAAASPLPGGLSASQFEMLLIAAAAAVAFSPQVQDRLRVTVPTLFTYDGEMTVAGTLATAVAVAAAIHLARKYYNLV